MMKKIMISLGFFGLSMQSFMIFGSNKSYLSSIPQTNQYVSISRLQEEQKRADDAVVSKDQTLAKIRNLRDVFRENMNHIKIRAENAEGCLLNQKKRNRELINENKRLTKECNRRKLLTQKLEKQKKESEDKLFSIKYDLDMMFEGVSGDYEDMTRILTKRHDDAVNEKELLINQLKAQVLGQKSEFIKLEEKVSDYQKACQSFNLTISELQKENVQLTQDKKSLVVKNKTLEKQVEELLAAKFVVSSPRSISPTRLLTSGDTATAQSVRPISPERISAGASVVQASAPVITAAAQTTNIPTAKPRKRVTSMFSNSMLVDAKTSSPGQTQTL